MTPYGSGLMPTIRIHTKWSESRVKDAAARDLIVRKCATTYCSASRAKLVFLSFGASQILSECTTDSCMPLRTQVDVVCKIVRRTKVFVL